MKVFVEVDTREIKAGTEAYAPRFHLASHGRDTTEAIEALRSGVVAWCAGLQRQGELERALSARGVRWEANGTGVTIEVIERT